MQSLEQYNKDFFVTAKGSPFSAHNETHNYCNPKNINFALSNDIHISTQQRTNLNVYDSVNNDTEVEQSKIYLKASGF